MNQIATTEIIGGIGVITIDSPPVNTLSTAVRRGLEAGFTKFLPDHRVRAIVLICEGRTFFAGAEISEFGKPPERPTLHEIFALMENAAKPVIAAIHGTALGGGLETALICHYRIAVPSARLGLPEVHLGLLPGGGGTQRLPRIVGVETALDLMVSGRAISAGEARHLGMVDAIASEGNLRGDAIGFAREVVARAAPLLRIRDRNDRIEEARAQPGLFAAFRARNAAAMRGFKAPDHIVRVVEATLSMSFDEGLAHEWALFRELEDSPESAAQRHMFFAERETAKVPDVPAGTPLLSLTRAIIIGQGPTSRAMTQLLEQAGLAVSTFDGWQSAQRDGAGALSIADIVVAAAAAGGVTTDLAAIAGAMAKADVLFASDEMEGIDRLPAVIPETANICGLYIPAAAGNRLVEIVRGDHSSAQAIATLLRLAKQAGRVPVVCRPGKGPITERLIAARDRQQDALSRQGVSGTEIDRVLRDFGFSWPAKDPGTAAVQDSEAILDRLLLPIVNEGARILAENAAVRASDIDVVAALALGWPAYRGGPMFWADSIGLPVIIERLKRIAAAHGPSLQPAPYLETLAREGRTFTHG